MPTPANIDHIVYAVPDLETGIDELETRLGVRPTPGGQHPGLGTRNALLSVGTATYLEVIGPDPDQPAPQAPRPFEIDTLEAPRIVTWSIRVEGLDAAAAAARVAGVDLGGVRSMSRARPDGSLLSWRLTPLSALLGDGLVPFLIDWGETPHPAGSAAQGCRLLGLRAEHPDPEGVRAMLRVLELNLPVERGEAPALIATIDTPAGRLELR